MLGLENCNRRLHTPNGRILGCGDKFVMGTLEASYRKYTTPHTRLCSFGPSCLHLPSIYNTEAAPIEQGTMRSLQAAIADAMAPTTTLRSGHTVHALDGFCTELDFGVKQFASKYRCCIVLFVQSPKSKQEKCSDLEHCESSWEHYNLSQW